MATNNEEILEKRGYAIAGTKGGTASGKGYAITGKNPSVNYNDNRFSQVESDKQSALADLESTYGDMIGKSDDFYQAQIDASKEWADKQSQIQQEQTDFAIEKIEQQKDQANKDYTKEQAGAYVDWQKQSNQYGANAEAAAAQGMTNTGFSESSQVSMYNTYQNRVATAREVFAQATLNYDNAMKDARLQNNARLAEIALEAYMKQAEMALQGFQYKNTLILEQANKKLEVENTYWSRYQDVLNQINTENALAEEIRQYNQNYNLQVDQFEEEKRQYNKQYELSIKQFNEEIRQFNQQYNESVRQFNQEYNLKKSEYQEGIRQYNEEIARLKAKDKQEYELEIKALEQNKKKLEQEQKQWESEQAFRKQQLTEEKRQFDTQMAEEKRQFNEQMDYTRSKSSGGNSSSSTGNDAYILESAEEPEISTEPTAGPKPEPKPEPTPAPTYQPVNKIATYEDAKKQMQKSGVPASAIAGLMNADNWYKRKKAFQKTGVGNEAVTNYGTYAMYVRDYVEGAIQYYKK